MMRAEVYQGLIDRGIPPHVAEGIVKNLQDESGLDPSINERNPTVPGSRGGFGLAQWTGPRRVALEQYAANQGKPADDQSLQLDFLVDELHGPESKTLERLGTTSTPGEAASVFAKDYLRPAKANLDRRVAAYTGGTWSEGGWSPEASGNALRQPPDYAGMVNRLAASLDEDPMAPQGPQGMWQGFAPDFFKSRGKFG